MTSERTSNPLQMIRQRLEIHHGNRMAVVQQRLNEGDVRDAMLAQGEANTCNMLLRFLDEYEETGEVPTLQDTESLHPYRKMSIAFAEAEEAANGAERGEIDPRGMH